MFGLTLTDHLRLTFGHVIYSHRAHADIAAQHAQWHRWLSAGGALAMLLTAIAAILLTTTMQPAYAVAAAVFAVLGVAAQLAQLVCGFDRSALVHRACAAHLWHIREQYRGLLADLHDGAITIEAARDRRDQLMVSLHHIYEHAPPADRAVYQAARQKMAVTDEATLSDEEIDRFLPMSLQKGRQAPA